MSSQMRKSMLCLTVNVHGSTPELRSHPEHELYGRLSYGKYGANVGNGRLLKLFEELGVKATFFFPAAEAERDPGLVEEVQRAGHEIAAHGLELGLPLAAAEEEETLAKALEALTKTTGERPVGWRSPGGVMSHRTLPILSKLGFTYDSTFQDDDFPYPLTGDGGGEMTELPQNQVMIDANVWPALLTHDRVFTAWNEELDAGVEEGCFLCLTLHARSDYGSGRASRIETVRRFLETVRDRGVPIVRCKDALPGA